MLLGFTATSCRDESLISYGAGEGKMTLRTSVMSDIKVVSRSLTEEQHNDLCTKALIWISDSQRNLLYKYNGLSSFPAEGLNLTSGSYLAEAWVGDSIPASWDGIRYHGTTPFDIATGSTTPVDIVCTVRNTLVSLTLSERLEDVLHDVSLTIGLNDGITDGSHSLTFEGDKLAEKGYFMINSRTKGFTWTIKGTDNTGKEFTRSGEYTDPDVAEAPNLARATEYHFNVKYDATGGDIEIGGAYFDIEVNPEPVEGTVEDVLIALAPEIVGIDGFDASRPVLGEPGNIGRRSIHIIGSSPLSAVIISGNLLTQAGLEKDYDLLNSNINVTHLANLAEKGINFKAFDNRNEPVEGEVTNLRLNLEEQLTNTLSAGEYQLDIQATDAQGKTSVLSLAFNITDAPGQLVEVKPSDVSYTAATIAAEVTKPGTRMGFEVKLLGQARSYEDWTFVEGTLEGTNLTVNLTDLQAGAEYAYRLVVDDYTSADELTFSTVAYPQLPNAGFEDWFSGSASPSNKNGLWLPCAVPELNGRFWDCGNHGSMKMNINVTTPDETVKHSGKYSIKLESAYPSMFGIGKFAAGNVFVGQYLKTDGTDGVLGFGRPFETPVRPKGLRGYIKYAPVAVTHTSMSTVSKGDMDTGIIYMALLSDDLKSENGDDEYNTWPVVIRTKTSKLFKKDASNVVAYGEKVFEGATSGDGMVEFYIPFDDVNGSLDFKYIMIVASASRNGDYFTGGVGSTMWLDDLELVY